MSIPRLATLVLTLAGALCPPAPAQQTPSFPHRVTDGLADLRNQAVLDADPGSRRRGRALLEETASRHGAAAWDRYTTAEVVGVDHWSKPGPWWPAQHQRVRLLQLLGTFTSRARLLDGPGRDQLWGLQSWAPYRQATPDAPPSFSATPDPAVDFYLPTLHYFNELIFRLRAASTVVEAGSATLDGRSYRLLFVTWGDPAPRDGVDHYVLWIDRGTGLVGKAHYTVRDIAAMSRTPPEQRPAMRAGAVGTMHYGDYRRVQGVRFPFGQRVTVFGPREAEDPATDFLHAFLVDSVRFDPVPASALVVDPTLPPPADVKPPAD